MLEFRDAARDHVIQIASEIVLMFDEDVGGMRPPLPTLSSLSTSTGRLLPSPCKSARFAWARRNRIWRTRRRSLQRAQSQRTRSRFK